MQSIPILGGLSDLAADYDAFVVDLWGVLHDGVTAFPAAVDCLRRLKERGARVVILSNAPRRAAAVAARNSELGIPEALCDLVMSSGELTWRHLKTRHDPWYGSLGRRCFHLGPARDQGMRDGLDCQFVTEPAAADFVLLTGSLSSDDTAADYADLLGEIRRAELPMVCANPDLEVIRGGRREICAGTIAAAYEAQDGQVHYNGKPHREIYDLCFQSLGLSAAGRIAAIGDSFRTDIKGAEAAGIDSIFVVDGIHGEDLGVEGDEDALARCVAEASQAAAVRPSAAMRRLTW